MSSAQPTRITYLEITVLKKAGIVVATSAAALLALSPLAFAAPSAGCEFGTQAAENSIQQRSESGDSTSFIGGVAGDAGSNTATITNGQSQAPVDSCNTDISETNVDVEDNDTTETVTDSFNETTEESVVDVDLLDDLLGGLDLGDILGGILG